ALQQEIVERERAERLQAALFQIAQLASADIGSNQFYPRVHQIVGQLLNADNFFIALRSEDGTRLEFPYYVSTRDPNMPEGRPLGRGLTELVLRRGEPFLGGPREVQVLEDAGELVLVDTGPRSLCWLGV